MLSSHVEGMQVSIISSFEKLGPRTIIIIPSGRGAFTEADIARLSILPDISKIMPTFQASIKVEGLDNPATFIGISAFDLLEFLGELRFTQGGSYTDVPAPQAILGHDVAYDPVTGETRYEVGSVIWGNLGETAIPLTVVGVLDTYGAITMISADETVFVPLEFVKKVTITPRYNTLIVKAVDVEVVDTVRETLTNVYGSDATILSVQQISRTISQILSSINILLISIASTAFIAAALGTFNIMMISVLERVREIGILKALGMKDREVLSLYVYQGILIGLLGNIVGLAAGIIISNSLTGMFTPGTSADDMPMARGGFMPSYTPLLNPTYIFFSIALSLTVTLMSTAYPAWKAAKLSPVEALRHE